MKKIKILLIILFLAFFNIINASSIDINYSGAFGGYTSSDRCGGNYCATDLQGAGVRITLLDFNGASTGKVADFWPAEVYEYVANNKTFNSNDRWSNYKKSCDAYYTVDIKSQNPTNIDIGLPKDINDSNAASEYKDFVDNLSSSIIEKILNKLGTNLTDSIQKNQILKIEPIYIIREFLVYDEYLYKTEKKGVCNHYSGTSYDIIYSFGEKYNIYSGAWTDKGLGKSYREGGNGNRYFVDGKKGIINGNWNVIRNYVVSMYLNSNIASASISKYEGDLSKLNAAEGTLWGPKNKNDTLLKIYSNNYENNKLNLGVGYVNIADFQSKTYSLTVNKVDDSGNPVEGVTITVGGVSKITNEKGIAVFSSLASGDDYIVKEELDTDTFYHSGASCKYTSNDANCAKNGNSKVSWKVHIFSFNQEITITNKRKKSQTIKIQKFVNGSKAETGSFNFKMYVGSCTGPRVNNGLSCKTNNGECSITYKLPENSSKVTYCVEEDPKTGYDFAPLDNAHIINNRYMQEITLTGNTTGTLNFYNEKTCVSEFNSLANKNSMASRIELYNKYKDKNGSQLNQLLNLTNKDATSACQYKKPTYTPQITCFNFKYPSNSEFNANNLSNYNEKFFSNDGYINFCLTTTNIYTEKKLPSDKIKVKAGMIVFDDKLQLKVVKTCYKYQYDNASSTSNSGFNYTLNDVWINKYRTSFTENIINNVRINKLITDYEYINEDKINYLKDIPNGSKSIPTGDEDTNLITSESKVDGKITYEYTYKYEYTPISLLYGSGKNIASKGKYSNNFNVPGIISTFSESGSQIIKFGVKYKDYTDNKEIYINTEDDDDNCKYTVDQAIITGSNLLNLQFEQVNLKNPFIEKNNNPTTGNVTIRKVGSNWRSIDINSFDLNGDGVRNEIDEAIKKYVNDFIKNPKASENGDNYLVKYVMNGRPNSYSKDKPKYVITLTPSDIKAIRNYNDSNDYQDYEKVYCTDSNNVLCSTDFIDNLKTTDPKVCVGDTCEKLSSGINFKREVTGGSDVKDASYIKFSLSNSDYGKIKGDMNIVVKKGDKVEFPELNIKEGYGLLGWITKNTNNRFNYNNYIDISNVTATLGTQEYMAVLAKEHKIYREADGNNSYVCTVLSRKSMQESGCPRLADPSNASGFEGWKYNNRVIDNYYTRKFITDNDDFIITFTPSYTQIKIYESIDVVMNNTKIRYSKRGVDIVSKIDKIIGTYSMNGKIISEPINKNQCEYDGDVHSTRLGKNTFRARCKRIYSKYIDYEIVKVPLDYIDTNKNALGAGIFTIYTNSNYENEISEAYIKDSENNTHKFERTHLGLRIDLKEFVPGKYPVGDYWFDLVFKGKNEDLITCKFKVTKTKLGLIPKRDVIICPEYQ